MVLIHDFLYSASLKFQVPVRCWLYVKISSFCKWQVPLLICILYCHRIPYTQDSLPYFSLASSALRKLMLYMLISTIRVLLDFCQISSILQASLFLHVAESRDAMQATELLSPRGLSKSNSLFIRVYIHICKINWGFWLQKKPHPLYLEILKVLHLILQGSMHSRIS